jgi:hypothetical protein
MPIPTVTVIQPENLDNALVPLELDQDAILLHRVQISVQTQMAVNNPRTIAPDTWSPNSLLFSRIIRYACS